MKYAPDAFMSYQDKADEFLEEVEHRLSQALTDNPEDMVAQLREVESWYGVLTSFLADANAFLAVAEDNARPPKGSGSEDDRKAAARAAVAVQRAFRDRVDGLTKAVNLRLMFGMALMKANRDEAIAGRATEKMGGAR